MGWVKQDTIAKVGTRRYLGKYAAVVRWVSEVKEERTGWMELCVLECVAVAGWLVATLRAVSRVSLIGEKLQKRTGKLWPNPIICGLWWSFFGAAA